MAPREAGQLARRLEGKRVVICGHLDPELTTLADRLLLASEQDAGAEAAPRGERPAKS